MSKRKGKRVEDAVEIPVHGSPLRPVPGLRPAAWRDGYDYIMHYTPPVFMQSIIDALEDGFTPEEIQYQLKRDLPDEKERVAISAKNCAYYILLQRGDIEV